MMRRDWLPLNDHLLRPIFYGFRIPLEGLRFFLVLAPHKHKAGYS
jgi:hypothetical protein